jgi:anti-anti-sigma factor
MTDATYSTYVEPETVVLEVSGEIDRLNAPGLHQCLLDLGHHARGHRIVLDLSRLTFIDSSGANTLIRFQQAMGHVHSIVLRNPHPNVRRALEISAPDYFELEV